MLHLNGRGLIVCFPFSQESELALWLFLSNFCSSKSMVSMH